MMTTIMQDTRIATVITPTTIMITTITIIRTTITTITTVTIIRAMIMDTVTITTTIRTTTGKRADANYLSRSSLSAALCSPN